MLRDYFIQKLKLRSPQPITTKDIIRFLKEMDTTIKSVDRIVEQKIKEYLKWKDIYYCLLYFTLVGIKN